MNLRVLQILAVQSIIFSFAFAKIQGIYIGSVPSNVLPPISLHIPQNYNHFVETSAEFAVHALNQELSLQKQSNSSKYPTSLPLVLREVHSEATQIGEGIIVGAWMEFDHGVRYEVKIAVVSSPFDCNSCLASSSSTRTFISSFWRGAPLSN